MDKLKLTILFFRESENAVIASCPALDISTCGETFKEARQNCAEMKEIPVYIIRNALRNLGMTPDAYLSIMEQL